MRRFIFPVGALFITLLPATCDSAGTEGSTTGSAGSSSVTTTSTIEPPDGGEDGDDGDDGDVVVPPVKTWTVEKTPVDVPLWRIWGSGPHDVYVAGDKGVILHSSGDGEWVSQAIGTTAPIADVSGSGPDDVYIASVFTCGPNGCNPDGSGGIDGGFYRSKGDGVWARLLPEYKDGFAVWMFDKDDGYVMGTSSNGDVLLRLKGPDNWVPEKLPIDNIGPRMMWSSSPSDIYILGQGNSLFHSKGDGTWTVQDHSWNYFFYSIWGSGPKDVYIVGPNALIFHSEGDGNWLQQEVPPLQNSPIGVWGSGPDDVYVVTGEILTTVGEILHSEGGGKWTLVEGSFPPLFAIWGSGPDDVYAVGDHGVILHLK